ncbi:MAG: hypothetical protein K2Q28_10575 [Hyphomicrobium sp.]|nr:hypothetical protein [Hyphomicrobium sp.]
MDLNDPRILKLAIRLRELRTRQTKILSFKAKRELKREIADTVHDLRCLGVSVDNLRGLHGGLIKVRG